MTFTVRSEEYIHCNGTPLRLTDSDFVSEQYAIATMATDCYVWTVGSRSSQLLFIFSTRVNLTTITLHYYSDSVRGLSRLRFWAVPDYFDIWDAPAIYTGNSYAEVASVQPGEKPSGPVNISVGFTTKRIL